MHRLFLLTSLMFTKLIIFGVDLRCYSKNLLGFVALYSYSLLLGVFCLFGFCCCFVVVLWLLGFFLLLELDVI